MGDRRGVSAIAVLVAAAFLLVACTAPQPERPPAATSSPASAFVEIPDTPVGKVAQWVIDGFNADAALSPAQWEARLHPDFLAQVSADEVADLVDSAIRPGKPFIVTAYQGSEKEAVITLAGKIGDPIDVHLTIDDGGQITGMLIAPSPPPHVAADSLDEVTERLQALPGDIRALVSLNGKQVVAIEDETAAPLGSIFKLYVLLAVADAVDTGVISWEQTMAVTDEVKSLPSGQLQDAEVGTEVTVREAAELMISISDNTATDMLIELVGRQAVEDAVATAGHHDPSLLRPFLTTREFFGLIWGDNSDLASEWPTADEAARRVLLNRLFTREFEVGTSDVDQTPRFADGFEWFATASDIAEVHEVLRQRGEQDPVISEVLTINPGIAIDSEVWPSVSFKGGSSPGVLTGSWDAVGQDGDTLSVVLLLSDPAKAISAEDQAELFGLASDLFTLLQPAD